MKKKKKNKQATKNLQLQQLPPLDCKWNVVAGFPCLGMLLLQNQLNELKLSKQIFANADSHSYCSRQMTTYLNSSIERTDFEMQ